MKIGGLQKLTLIDYPGKIACTVFLCGCNFRCRWCYNPELVLPEKIKKQPQILEKEFFDFLKSRRGLLEGVCISGGEPTIHKDLPNFIKKIKKLGYLIKLDTNGSNPEVLKKLINGNLLNYIAVDIKEFKEKNLEKSIKILKESKIEYEFRTTVVPIVLDKKKILKIARWLTPAKRYYLQNFRPEKTVDLKFEKIKPYPNEYLLEIQKAIAPFFEICQIR